MEGVGEVDRAKITAYLKSHTFKTIIGEADIRNQKLNRFWTVGSGRTASSTPSTASASRTTSR